MKIRHKILLSLLSVLSLMCFVTIFTYLGTKTVNYYRARTLLLEDKLVATTNLRAQVRNQLLETYEVGFIEDLQPHLVDLKNERELVQKNFISLEEIMKNEDPSDTLTILHTEYEKLNQSLGIATHLLAQGNFAAAKKALLEARKNNFNDGFIKKISTIIEDQKVVTRESSQSLERSILHLQRMLITFSVFALIMVIILVIFISKSIGKRLLDLEEATRKISEGNYNIKLSEKGSDEVSILSKAFNKMVASLLQTNDEIIKQQEIITQTSKMSALGEMAGGIAHEINTPLAAMILNAELIEMQNSDLENPSAEITEHSQQIIDIGARIGKIIMGLKGFSRDAKDDKKEQFTIRELIYMTTDLCKEKFKNHGVKIVIEENLLEDRIYGQIVQLSQTLLNLLNNSYDAVQGLDQKWVQLKVVQNEKHIELRVTDSGTALPSHLVDKIFNPFFTTKDIGKGTGLGLSISKNIMKQHNGDLIYDQSSPHTCFIIQFQRGC